MWVQSRSVHFGKHPFTHKVDLYLDTDLDWSGLVVPCKQGLSGSNPDTDLDQQCSVKWDYIRPNMLFQRTCLMMASGLARALNCSKEVYARLALWLPSRIVWSLVTPHSTIWPDHQDVNWLQVTGVSSYMASWITAYVQPESRFIACPTTKLWANTLNGCDTLALKSLLFFFRLFHLAVDIFNHGDKHSQQNWKQ